VTPERPAGVTVVASAFLLAAAYLCTVGLTMLVRPELVPLGTGRELLGGFAFAGPQIFLFTAALCAAVAFGLWRLHRWARWAAILLAVIGVVLLVPGISGAVVFFRLGKLAWGGVGVMLRTMIVWYLFQEPVGDAFAAR
jgi:cell division protein FtsW (lipid II flippase)